MVKDDQDMSIRLYQKLQNWELLTQASFKAVCGNFMSGVRERDKPNTFVCNF